MKKLCVALLVPLILLLAAEGLLTLFGVAAIPPRFVLRRDAQGTICCSNKDSAFWSEPFLETCVRPVKQPCTYRIFVIGESTPNGFPFSRHCTPARWLQVRLEQLHPGRSIEVVGLAANGKVASDLVDFSDEILAWRPDLLVTYVGHNEFILVSIPEIKHPAQFRVRSFLLEFRVGRTLSSLVLGNREPPPDELPDTRLVADQPYLSHAEFRYGHDRYRRSLEALREKCRACGTQLLLCLPACNLRDYPPTYSSFGASTSAAARERGRALLEQAIDLVKAHELDRARPLLEQAIAIDATPAIAHYQLGAALLQQDAARARREFELARDLDCYPNRAQQPLLDIVREQAAHGVLIADCPDVFNEAAEHHVPGCDLFVDHCHPEISAQSLIATAIMRAMASANLLAPANEWHFEREPDLAEYHRRLKLSFPDIASEFAATAINSLLNRLRLTTRRLSAAESAERGCAFAMRYDPQNGTAMLGQALAAFVLGRKEEARVLAARAIERDPRLRFYPRQLPAKYPELKDLFAP
ncbi:MAG: hypothetical protein U1E76_24160 [Planctomycetota bacterium]